AGTYVVGVAPEPSPNLPPADSPPDGRRRVVVDALSPAVDGGRFALKRIVGDRIAVEADLLVDGHDRVAGALLYRRAGADAWQEVPLAPAEPDPQTGVAINDRWRATFTPDGAGAWEYTVSAWVDAYASWAHGLRRK